MGITDIKTSHYIIGCLGMLPGVLVYVFIGTTVSSIAEAAGAAVSGDKKEDDSVDNSTLTLILVIVGSILACGGIIWVSAVAKRILDEELKKAEDEKEGENPT
jgi:uncharacterized membrane protein YdjX (TVP38/TMEM64 family)